ncbi:MAG: hypothetical protein AB7T22_10435 [Calditrichaceae bacterium]
MRNLTGIIMILLFLTAGNIFGQACCSAGTPLLSALEISATPDRAWQFALTYEYNFLQDVVAGTDQLDDGARERLSQSLLTETSYGFNRFFSVSLLLSFIQQERKLSTANYENSDEKLTTRGFGDAVVLLKYNLLPLTIASSRQVSVGGGVKLPTGESGLRSNGILLPADMQPGTGAWDGILWGYVFQGLTNDSRYNLFANATYRFTGTNDRFQVENSSIKGYKFGNEFVMTIGMAYRTRSLLDFSVLARYRHLVPDRFSGSDITNTGGEWLYLVPGINLNINKLSIRLSGQLPAYRNLNGIQLTTSYTASLSLFYILQSNRKGGSE